MRTKYGAQAVTEDGLRFASKREHARYRLLKARESAGEIAGLELQPRFPLVVEGKRVAVYIADFQYREGPERFLVVEDVKGVKTPVYRLKKKMMKALYGIDVLET